MSLDAFVPSLFSAEQKYCPESEELMELKTSCGPSLRRGTSAFLSLLYQVYLAAGLASLLQVRVTELPSFISPEGLTDKEVIFGAAGGDVLTENIQS